MEITEETKGKKRYLRKRGYGHLEAPTTHPDHKLSQVQWSFGYMAIQLYGRSSQNLDVNLLSVIWPFSYMAGHITAIQSSLV